MQQSALNALRRMASLRITAAGLCALVLGILVDYRSDAAAPGWLLVPLGVLAANLTAAIATNTGFRRHPSLLLFHVTLLVGTFVAGWGHLASFQGRIELAEGQTFEPQHLTTLRRGSWHDGDALEEVEFTQQDILVRYWDGDTRRSIQSRISTGRDHPEIRDNDPWIDHGYRFYPTANKGFAAVVTWSDARGRALTGTVNFPSYPMNAWNQRNSVLLPDGVPRTVELELPADLSHDGAWELRGNPPGARIRLGDDASARWLGVGETLPLSDGTVRFEGVVLWMGYAVYRNPALPALFAIGFVALAFLSVYLLGRPAAAGSEASSHQPAAAGAAHA